MGWVSFAIGRLFGIPLRVHWTMLGVVGLFMIIAPNLAVAIRFVALTFLVLLSVVVHELGHALVARRFGIATQQILLMPLNGAAVLESRPERWSHDFWIAFAGPATSLAFAGLGFGIAALIPDATAVFDLAVVSLYLGVFNLIPAFPLDGGRMLRAGLERWISPASATRTAARIGRVIAAVGFAWGLVTGHLVAAFFAMFVFSSATNEERVMLIHGALAKRRVLDAMEGVREAVPAGGDVGQALKILGDHPMLAAVPVTFGARVVGVIHRTPLLFAAAQGLGTGINELLDRNVVTFDGDGPLQVLLKQMGAANSRAAVIVDGAEVRGIITVERVVESLRAAM